MRQKKETATSFNKLATSFNKLKEITQAIQVQKNSALKPTKRAFSERQRTTIRENSQSSVKETKER
ncbi:hypothetical protein ACPDJR_07735 [Helicobacter pylori]|uniref:hypothetical protein n=1 Tax=Helicobacter pylori TaxID=210 RepID=UPI0030893E9D|nr:hypothetical protein KVM58_03760 [Helicobacter pylori]